ncbi:hypothetical protein [Arthrobacter sp. D1-17]
MADKLQVLVRVDLDGRQAKVATAGHVIVQGAQGLYDVMKRATSLVAGLALELDMTQAEIEPGALEQLHACSTVMPHATTHRSAPVGVQDQHPHAKPSSVLYGITRFGSVTLGPSDRPCGLLHWG